MYCRNDSKEGKQQGMGLGLAECSVEGKLDMADKGVREEAIGKIFGLCSTEADI